MKKLRQKLAFWIVRLAVRIYPRSPEVSRFYSTICTDAMTRGKAVTRINPNEFFVKAPNKANPVDANIRTKTPSAGSTADEQHVFSGEE